MHPILIRLGPLFIPTYGFLFASGVLLGILVDVKLAKREGIDQRVFSDFLFYGLLSSLLGAKLLLLLTSLKYYLEFPGELVYLLTSGGTFFGGLIVGLLFTVWFVRKKQMNFRRLGDVTVPGLALGHFFGRLGCFGAGCCFGRFADGSPLAVMFSSQKAHDLTGVPLHLPLYPTQLLEAAGNLLNFLILLALFRRRKYPGQVLTLYIFNYSLLRFVVEYFRGDPDRGYIWGGPQNAFLSLSLPQLTCLGGLALAILLCRVFRKQGEKEDLP